MDRTRTEARNVAIVLFDGVELLDFAGPLEVFAVASNMGELFRVYTVAEQRKPVTDASGLSVNPACAIYDCPRPDIVVVPGGIGTRTEMDNRVLTDWLRVVSDEAELMLSVCTGALLLAKAGLLAGMRVTTHHMAFDILRSVVPDSAEVVEGVRFVDNGKFILSAGISAGIDMALHTVARLHGEEHAQNTARRMEYDWSYGGAGE